MAKDKKSLELDPGFEEVALDEGFEEVPLNQPKTAVNVLKEKLGQAGSELADVGKSALQTGLETAADTSRAVGQGLTMGLSDEGIAGLKALKDIAGPNKELKDFKDLFRKYQESEQAKVKAAEERSPIATTIGEIGGAILPAIASAGASLPAAGAGAAAKLTAKGLAKSAIKAVPEMAALGGIYGLGKSEEGKIIGATPEELEKAKADTLSGAITGTVVGVPLTAAAQVVPKVYKAGKEKILSKIGNYIDDSPALRVLRKSKEFGEEGTNIFSEKTKQGKIGEKGLITRDTDNASDLMNRIYNIDEKLGQNVGKSIDDATSSGRLINLEDEMYQTAKNFVDIYNQDATLALDPKAKKLYEQIFKLQKTNLTPREVQSLRSNVSDFASSIKLKDPHLASLGNNFQWQIGNVLKQEIPEYKLAAQRFEEFRRLVPETLISGSIPVDISKVNMGKLKNDEVKLFTSIRNMLQGATKQGTSQKLGSTSREEAETFKNFITGFDKFETNEADRIKQGLVKNLDIPKLVTPKVGESQTKALQSLIRDKADESALLQQAWGVTGHQQQTPKGAIKTLMGVASPLNIANKYGLHKEALLKPIKSPVNLTKKITQATETELRSLAQKLNEMPGVSSIGKALLDGLENKDQAKVNAALFSIMQNPQARILLNAEDVEQESTNPEDQE